MSHPMDHKPAVTDLSHGELPRRRPRPPRRSPRPAAGDIAPQILAAMADAVVVMGPDGRIATANSATYRLLGYAEPELIGKLVTTLFPNDETALRVTRLQTVQDGAELRREEICYRATDGTEIPVSVTCSAMVGEDGFLSGVVIVARDLRETKRLLAQAREARAKLAEKATHLEQEIQRRQQVEAELLHAQKLEAVGRLAGGLAHEINTPLQYVGDSLAFIDDACGELLEAAEHANECCDQYQLEDLDYLRTAFPRALVNARSGIQQISTIIGAMQRGFSCNRPEGAVMTDLDQLVQDAIVVAGSEFGDIEVAFHGAQVPLTACQPEDLSHVMLNLLINAADAMSAVDAGDNRPKQLTVSTNVDGDSIIVKVRDTGTGIPSEHAARVFDPFFTTKEPGQGTGQGLTMAHAIVVDEHGGALTFESQLGVGTTFTMRLPIRSEWSSR